MSEFPVSPMDLGDIARQVARHYGLTVEELRGPCRRRRVAHPRHEAMTLTYDTGRFSTTRIGLYYGGRDHSTVWRGIEAHEARKGLRPKRRHPHPAQESVDGVKGLADCAGQIRADNNHE